MEAYLDSSLTSVLKPPVSEQAAPQKRVLAEQVPLTSRWATALSFLLTDLSALAILAGMIYLALGYYDAWALGPVLAPIIGLILTVNALAGLYDAANMHPAQELRLAAGVTTIVFIVYAVALLPWPSHGREAAGWLGAAWLLSVALIPAFRAFARVVLARAAWWGTPVVVIASGAAGLGVIRTLKRWPELGLKPVALLQTDLHRPDVDGVPVVNDAEFVLKLARQRNIPCAILAMPELAQGRLAGRIRRYGRFFKRVLVVPDVPDAAALWTTQASADGLIGYGVRHWTRFHAPHVGKRCFDILGALLGLMVLGPLLLVVAVSIKLDTPGSVFFRQVRIGREGRCFTMLKFRSMYEDAARLEDILDQDPQRREEYERYHKLKDDPRITRVGRFVRKYSLDELPQLWNVVSGNISLVGPRAYVPGELSAMRGLERVIQQSRPGITGLWQVSGRNGLTFEERIKMDVHYVHNWTPWLDIYILARTIPAVVLGEGAV